MRIRIVDQSGDQIPNVKQKNKITGKKKISFCGENKDKNVKEILTDYTIINPLLYHKVWSREDSIYTNLTLFRKVKRLFQIDTRLKEIRIEYKRKIEEDKLNTRTNF